MMMAIQAAALDENPPQPPAKVRCISKSLLRGDLGEELGGTSLVEDNDLFYDALDDYDPSASMVSTDTSSSQHEEQQRLMVHIETPSPGQRHPSFDYSAILVTWVSDSGRGSDDCKIGHSQPTVSVRKNWGSFAFPPDENKWNGNLTDEKSRDFGTGDPDHSSNVVLIHHRLSPYRLYENLMGGVWSSITPNITQSQPCKQVLSGPPKDSDWAIQYWANTIPTAKVTTITHPSRSCDYFRMGYQHFQMGMALAEKRDWNVAMSSFEKAADCYRNCRKDVALAKVLNQQGILYHRMRLTDAAVSALQMALQLRSKHLGSAHPDTIDTVANLGHACRRLGQIDKARECYRYVQRARRDVFGFYHPSVAVAAHDMGRVEYQLKQFHEAHRWFKCADHIYRTLHVGIPNPAVQRLHRDRRKLQRVLSKNKDA